jgi:hypothetical protein
MIALTLTNYGIPIVELLRANTAVPAVFYFAR